MLGVVDTQTHKIVQSVGPFDGPIRPFTVNAAKTLCFVNVNNLLGFEVGDMTSGLSAASLCRNSAIADWQS